MKFCKSKNIDEDNFYSNRCNITELLMLTEFYRIPQEESSLLTLHTCLNDDNQLVRNLNPSGFYLFRLTIQIKFLVHLYVKSLRLYFNKIGVILSISGITKTMIQIYVFGSDVFCKRWFICKAFIVVLDNIVSVYQVKLFYMMMLSRATI